MSVAPDNYASLRSAAQYVRAFRGKTFVFKLGGEVLDQERSTLTRQTARHIRERIIQFELQRRLRRPS